MTPAERLALAMLRGGCSYEDAAKASHLSVEHVTRLWRENEKAPHNA